MDLGTIWASVGLKTAPLEAGVIKAKGMMTGLDASLSTGKLKNAETGLAGLGTKLKNLTGLGGGASSALSGVGASIGTLGEIGIAVGAVVGLGAALFSCAKAAAEEQKIMAQAEAVIASTGGVANVTADHVNSLGNSLAAMTGISHDTIKTGENILLTFRGIQNQTGKDNDIFDQATTATLDLSVAMGRDMSKSAIMVGKALQDPVRGLTAMRRVGVQFTDAQETMIKNMVATGNTIGAQKIILAELNAEFGKSAEAYGKTLPGQIGKAKDAFDQLKESIGAEILGPAVTSLEELASVFKTLDKIQVPKFIGAIIGQLTNLKNVIGLVTGPFKAFYDLGVSIEHAIFGVKPKPIEIKPIINKSGLVDLGGVIEGITGKFSNLRSMMDSTFAEMDQSSKDLADTLGTTGLKGVVDSQMKDMLDSLTSGQPRVRKVGKDMMKQLVDSVAESDTVIKDNASKIGDDISMALEQALEVGPVSDKQMAEIALSIIKQYPGTSAALKGLEDNLQGIINGTPLVITPTVDPKSVDTVFGSVLDTFENFITGKPITAKVDVETAQASQNVTGLKANMETIQDKGVTASTETAQASQNVTGLRNNIAGLQDRTITLTVVTNEVKTKVSPEKSWSSAFAAGKYVAGEIGAGMQANAPTMSAMVSGAGGGLDAATAKYEEDIFSWEQQIAETERQIADLRKQGASQDDARIKNLEAQRDIQQNEKELIDKTYQVSYAGMNRELEKQNKLIDEAKTKADELKQKEEDAARKREEALNKWKDGLNSVKSGVEALISSQEDYLSKLGSMGLKGEGAAADKSFAMDEKSKKLQLEIMKAEDAHNYALAAKLNLEKEVNDRTKEEADLQTSITYDPQHRALEKLLDPLKGQEMTYKKIKAEILRIQNSLKAKYNWVNNITKALGEQIKSVKQLKKEYDKLNSSKPAGGTKVAALSTPSGGGATVVHVNSILDGKIVAKSVTKILGGNASAYAASGGRY